MRIFGQHDENTIRQLQDVASRAERAALMADGHVGYIMPIGGVAAYRDQVSVVGVGFDIACLAAGTPVSTLDGYFLPVERVQASDSVICWDGERVRAVVPHIGAVPRGAKPVFEVALENGRTLRATGDHQIRTRNGWREAGSLSSTDAVACSPYVGVPHAPAAGEMHPAVPRPGAETRLRELGLYPLRLDNPLFPALIRLLAYVSGDGHLTTDGKRISIYTTSQVDAANFIRDFARLGFRASIHRRERGPGRRAEIQVCVNSTALHALFAALGSPVGRKRWPPRPMPWLLELPAWMRAHWLSAFCSAEMTTPRVHRNGTVANLQLKQAGEDRHAIHFVAQLFRSLEFDVSVAQSGPSRGARHDAVLQLLGGQAAQLRFLREVGFCYAREKRVRAAEVASVAWQGAHHVRNRDVAKGEARRLRVGGGHWREVVEEVSPRFGVAPGFVYHSIYDNRGASRRSPGAAVVPEANEEICWVKIAGVRPAGLASTYDIVTGDPAQSFLAGGVVVHNCGNAAIRTDLSLAQLGSDEPEVGRTLNTLADEIQTAVSFGVGRKNRADDAPTDHPLFEDAAWDAIPPRERGNLREKARAQLGTVGSGNHYVDVFADETGTLWVGVHFGSRGFGHTVASGFLALGQGRGWKERVPEKEVLLPLEQPLGHDYWTLMSLAGRYAYAGREWVARKVVELMGGREIELVHNHHNFAWRETHEGEEYIVVRKGATPAFPGQKGFIGGSMGDNAVIVQGTPAEHADPETARLQREALFSTVHGAGRVMSRTEAAGKRRWKTGEIIRPGRVTPEMMQAWIADKGVILRGGGLDESPHAYRRLPEVLRAQGSTVEVLHTLRPLIVVMAGANEFDPYKD